MITIAITRNFVRYCHIIRSYPLFLGGHTVVAKKRRVGDSNCYNFFKLHWLDMMQWIFYVIKVRITFCLTPEPEKTGE